MRVRKSYLAAKKISRAVGVKLLVSTHLLALGPGEKRSASTFLHLW